jgi:hypothetical protein
MVDLFNGFPLKRDAKIMSFPVLTVKNDQFLWRKNRQYGEFDLKTRLKAS